MRKLHFRCSFDILILYINKHCYCTSHNTYFIVNNFYYCLLLFCYNFLIFCIFSFIICIIYLITKHIFLLQNTSQTYIYLHHHTLTYSTVTNKYTASNFRSSRNYIYKYTTKYNHTAITYIINTCYTLYFRSKYFCVVLQPYLLSKASICSLP